MSKRKQITFSFKSVLGTNIRRFELQKLQYGLLLESLHALYTQQKIVNIKYKDHDGDLIIISSTKELEQAWKFHYEKHGYESVDTELDLTWSAPIEFTPGTLTLYIDRPACASSTVFTTIGDRFHMDVPEWQILRTSVNGHSLLIHSILQEDVRSVMYICDKMFSKADAEYQDLKRGLFLTASKRSFKMFCCLVDQLRSCFTRGEESAIRYEIFTQCADLPLAYCEYTVPTGQLYGDENEILPLLAFVTQWDNMHLLKLLLSKPIDVNQPNANGISPLEFAIKNGNEETVQLLLHAKAEIRSVHLKRACEKNHVGIARLLLEYDHTLYNDPALIPFVIDTHDNFEEMVTLLAVRRPVYLNSTLQIIKAARVNLNAVKLLLKLRADVNVKFTGMTMLDRTLLVGQVEATKFLLQHGGRASKRKDAFANAVLTKMSSKRYKSFLRDLFPCAITDLIQQYCMSEEDWVL